MLAFVPFVALSYRRRGGMSLGRSLLWFAALVYAMALWTYTLVPFPQSRDVQCAPTQLVPLQFVADVLREGVSSLGAIIHNAALLQVAFNVLLFLPLGWFARWLAGRGLVVATLCGFAVSLAIELTQVTGLWGLYSCAWRIFDVDDLLANTAGAFLGSLLGMLLWRRRRDRVDAAEPRPITVTRRFLGILCDLAIMWLSVFAVGAARVVIALVDGRPQLALPDSVFSAIAFAIPFIAQLVVVLASGATIGEHIVLLSAQTGRVPAPLVRLLRFGLGIGGYMLLSTFEFPFSGLLLAALVVTTIVMVFTTKNHRGFAAAASDLSIIDARRAPTSEERRRAG
ncbi:VanZ like family protein [Paramicrobacterium humi]|uniref:VanZ like family protein n=1 Tax=Paramicrobacterium humi TaxID=640635 RepID=A0A1H4LCR4_9MICO|nr:VanZ family protein [Microbacterium humi]SEB68534.1 VanZ like family protein [Microbacterium humi]